MNRQSLGQYGESLASKFLQKKGYRILKKNYRCSHGEIDIIAEKSKCLIFVEVRTKTDDNFGSPEESITSGKKKRLIDSAFYYASSQGEGYQNWRIDFIAIELDRLKNKVKRIEHIENALA